MKKYLIYAALLLAAAYSGNRLNLKQAPSTGTLPASQSAAEGNASPDSTRAFRGIQPGNIFMLE